MAARGVAVATVASVAVVVGAGGGKTFVDESSGTTFSRISPRGAAEPERLPSVAP